VQLGKVLAGRVLALIGEERQEDENTFPLERALLKMAKVKKER
jgi:hypothetical protein